MAVCETYAVCVAGISSQEHPMVERVLVRDALADRVHRVPLHRLPFYGVRLKDLLGGRLNLWNRRRLPRMRSPCL